jgi:Flp pilus assembly pilin Flp
MRKNILNNKSGQGATEYILLLVVIVGLVMMFGPRIKTAIQGKVGDLEKGMEEIQAK